MSDNLSVFATKLAEAIARRHALDQIAETGEAVPAGVDAGGRGADTRGRGGVEAGAGG